MSSDYANPSNPSETPISFLQESTISSLSTMPETNGSPNDLAETSSGASTFIESSMGAMSIQYHIMPSVSLSRSPPILVNPNPTTTSANAEAGTSTATSATDIDAQILEALRSKDRLYVLKIGEIMEALINDRRPGSRADVNPTTSYQRLLVHRCSAYYKLIPESDPVTKTLWVVTTTESRTPSRRLADLVPTESPPPPAFKIMRRTQADRRQKPQSQAGSVAGDDAELSDNEPSEAGSVGGRSNATGSSGRKQKRAMTIEEREAAYNEARNRIFMGFEEKEKDKDMSASSSSLSLASASTSGGGSSFDEIDDSASSLAPESEWSAHSFSRDNADVRRPGNSSGTTTVRSLRSSAPPFNSNAASSSRNSRSSSPSFSYTAGYDHSPWDPSLQGSVPGQGYHPQQPMYPVYSPPGQLAHPQYMPYPYFPAYVPYPPPPQNVPEQSPPPSGEIYGSPSMTYPYMWPLPPHLGMHPPPATHMQPTPASQNQPQDGPHTATTSSLSSQTVPYHPSYMHPPTYAYPPSGYWTPQPNQQHMPVPPHMGQSMYDIPSSLNGTSMNGDSSVGNGNGLDVYNNPTGRNEGVNMSKVRSAPPQPRSAWSYGPGIGMGGVSFNGGPMNGHGEAVGPRFGSMRRQPSNHSNGSSHRRSSNNDDVSSIASSSTSSSSRRTYTSTTSSSHHPLPPRPDWAVGLKPDPTLHATNNRHHDPSAAHSRNMSPMPRNINGNSRPSSSARRQPPHTTPPLALHPTDFPPLTSTEKRAPAVAGAWTNTSARSLLINASNSNQGNALVHHPNPNTGRQEELDRTFERPPPRAAELFNPKLPSKSHRQNGTHPRNAVSSTERINGDRGRSELPLEQIRTLSLDGHTSTECVKELVAVPL